MEKNKIPTSVPFIDGEHCFFYDPLDESSIINAIKRAKYYLAHDDERKMIADNGRRFAMENHAPFNRIEEILQELRIRGVIS